MGIQLERVHDQIPRSQIIRQRSPFFITGDRKVSASPHQKMIALSLTKIH